MMTRFSRRGGRKRAPRRARPSSMSIAYIHCQLLRPRVIPRKRASKGQAPRGLEARLRGMTFDWYRTYETDISCCAPPLPRQFGGEKLLFF